MLTQHYDRPSVLTVCLTVPQAQAYFRRYPHGVLGFCHIQTIIRLIPYD